MSLSDLYRWELAGQFRQRGPWITQFRVKGRSYGGQYDPASDWRYALFLQRHPQPGRVLELGCLEGGYTVEIARRASEVVAIDGRSENLERARWIAKQIVPTHNVTWAEADLETADLSAWGSFDCVFNVGLLYHLRRPLRLLEQCAAVAPRLWLWTHVASEITDRDEDGYAGQRYRERGRADVLSGLGPASCWPGVHELSRMLLDAGYQRAEIVADDRHHNGRSVLIDASRN